MNGRIRHWNWRSEGFRYPPKLQVMSRPVTVYRVWGGASSELGSPIRAGVCFTFERPRTRMDAEALFSLWEWGNTCRYVTPFRAEAGTELFVGEVHPGEYYDPAFSLPGSQVFVETPQVRLHLRKIGAAVRLADDVGGGKVVIPDSGARRLPA